MAVDPLFTESIAERKQRWDTAEANWDRLAVVRTELSGTHHDLMLRPGRAGELVWWSFLKYFPAIGNHSNLLIFFFFLQTRRHLWSV